MGSSADSLAARMDALADALRAAGVDVTLERYDDMVHSFLRWGGVVERARDLVEALGEYTRGALR